MTRMSLDMAISILRWFSTAATHSDLYSLPQLDDPIINHPHIMAKLSLQLIQSDVRILDHIMQKQPAHRHLSN